MNHKEVNMAVSRQLPAAPQRKRGESAMRNYLKNPDFVSFRFYTRLFVKSQRSKRCFRVLCGFRFLKKYI
jgi:hypothetical protein